MANPVHPHPERSRHSRRRLAAAPYGEGTHDDYSEITSLLNNEPATRRRSRPANSAPVTNDGRTCRDRRRRGRGDPGAETRTAPGTFLARHLCLVAHYGQFLTPVDGQAIGGKSARRLFPGRRHLRLKEHHYFSEWLQ